MTKFKFMRKKIFIQATFVILVYFFVLVLTDYYSAIFSFFITLLSFIVLGIHLRLFYKIDWFDENDAFYLCLKLMIACTILSYIAWGYYNNYFLMEKAVIRWILNAFKKAM